MSSDYMGSDFTDQDGSIAAVSDTWRVHADALADWSMSRIFVRRDVYGRTNKHGERSTGHDPVTRELLVEHYQGLQNVGAHLTSPENLCICLIADIDSHDDTTDREVNWQCVNIIMDTLQQFDLYPLICDSNGKGGYHVREFFKKPVESRVVYWLGQTIRGRLKSAGLPDVEFFPKQGEVTIHTPYGNWVRLPGKHHKREHYTRVWNGHKWLEGEAAIKALIHSAGDMPIKLVAEFSAHHPASSHGGSQATQRNDKQRPDVTKIQGALKCFANDDLTYDEWLAVGMALNSWDSSSAGFSQWRSWSSQSSKHDDATTEAKWGSFSPNGGITIASLFKAAMDHGWKPNDAAQNGSVKSRSIVRPAKNQKIQVENPEVNSGLDPIEAELASFPRTDLGNAERLIKRFGENLRHCPKWRKWMVWNDTCWHEDDHDRVPEMAHQVARKIREEARTIDDPKEYKSHAVFAVLSESDSRMNAMLHVAESMPGIPILPERFDSEPMLLNVQNGTVDLRTGQLLPHRREDLLMMLAGTCYDPTAICDVWESMLDRIFAKNDVLIAYVQRLMGVCLTGRVEEQILPIFWGVGANGKTTMLTAIQEIMGDYAATMPANMLLLRKFDSHPTELAMLRGKRLIIASETPEGAHLNEPLVKLLTGSDRITARRMREDFWTFRPTHKIILMTNHKPVIQEREDAIWRRIKLVPFNVSIAEPDQDKTLAEKLRSEYQGILSWCVRGCLDWLRNGLRAPEEVIDATQVYREESDDLEKFFEEECNILKEAECKSSVLYERFVQWSGSRDFTMKGFSKALQSKGYRVEHKMYGNFFIGIGLRANAEENQY